MIICADVMDWDYDGPKFHALLCDPPYELGFMGKDWDRSGVAFQSDTWAALAEHLHPGAFGMAFASARGWHRLAVAIEDAGLRIHPAIFGWSYGSGFPKATRIDTQIDKAAGAERIVVGHKNPSSPRTAMARASTYTGYDDNSKDEGIPIEQPATSLAQAWQGHRYGLQALKPALEPIIVFQKPYTGKPVECITETGAGSLWIDGGRINTSPRSTHGEGTNKRTQPGTIYGNGKGLPVCEYPAASGRWPANFYVQHHPECRRVGERRVGSGERRQSGKRAMRGNPIYGKPNMTRHSPDNYGLETIAAWDCHESCPVYRLGRQSGERAGFGGFKKPYNLGMKGYGVDSAGEIPAQSGPSDSGTAARFFFQAAYNLEHADPVMYCAKASRKARNHGLDDFFWRKDKDVPFGFVRITCEEWEHLDTKDRAQGNVHSTVKPIALTKWLATLLLPPEEYAPRHLLIPFAGSGSEGIGAGLAGWDEMTLIEMDADTCEIAEARLAHWLTEPRQLELG